MSALDVQRRRGRAQPGARRRGATGGRPAVEAAPRLFPEPSGDGPAPSGDGCAAARPRPGDQASPDGRGDGMSLAELVGNLWEGMLTEGRTTCPMCGGELVGRASPHARPTEGRCGDCGTTID